MASILDELIARQDELAEQRRLDRLANPFPRNAAGQLINPDYIQAEDARIRAALGVGANGTGVIPAPAFITNANVDPIATERYGDSFFRQPSIWEQNQNPAQLRQQLKLDELTTIAAQRKFDLERSQRQAPLQDRLLEAQINASGAHDRFMREQDTQFLNATGGFLNDLITEGAPKPGDPRYRDHVIRALDRNRAIAKTPGGKAILKELATGDDVDETIASIVGKLPQGFDVSSVRIGEKGKPSFTAKPVGTDKDLEEQLKTGYKLSLGQVRNPVNAEVGTFDPVTKAWKGDPRGNIVRVDDGEGKKVTMSAAEYERFGGKYSPETLAARGTASAAPDLRALATEALNDPTASEAHKAAARKLLGL